MQTGMGCCDLLKVARRGRHVAQMTITPVDPQHGRVILQ
jgi:hypothetical protein